MKDKNEEAHPSGEPHEHEWVVFSTALAEVCIMVQCVECGAQGTVDDPSKDEWSNAFCAPDEPYLWKDNSRVTLRSLDGDCFVEKVEDTAELRETINHDDDVSSDQNLTELAFPITCETEDVEGRWILVSLTKWLGNGKWRAFDEDGTLLVVDSSHLRKMRL